MFSICTDMTAYTDVFITYIYVSVCLGVCVCVFVCMSVSYVRVYSSDQGSNCTTHRLHITHPLGDT